MDVDPVLPTPAAVHPDELVGVAIARVRIAQDAAQLLVEEYMTTCPVDVAVHIGEVERKELGEGVLDGLLPRTVEAVRRVRTIRRVGVIRIGDGVICVHGLNPLNQARRVRTIDLTV